MPDEVQLTQALCEIEKKLHNKAVAIIAKLVRTEKLPRLDGAIDCVDCGTAAACYDHRDYSKPEEVEPVCKMCNYHRGSAKGYKETDCSCAQCVQWRQRAPQSIRVIKAWRRLGK